MTRRDEFPLTARTLAALKHEQGRVNLDIPKHLRERQCPFDEKCDRILSGKVGFGLSSGRRHPLHLRQIDAIQENDTNHIKENGNISNGGKRGKCSLSDP